MSTQEKLTGRERCFCYHYAHGCDAEHAAARAGLSLHQAIELIGKEKVTAEVHRLWELEQERLQSLARLGLGRLAAVDNRDAVKLALHPEELGDEELERLDLYGVSSIMTLKGGGVEIGLYDRLRALEALGAGEKKVPDEARSFYSALISAGKGAQEPREDEDGV